MLKKSKHAGLAVLAVIIGLCLAVPALAAEFSADMKMQGQGKTMPGKVYVKDHMIRQEMSPVPGMVVATVINTKTKEILVMNSQAKMYTKHTLKDIDAMGGKVNVWEGKKSLPPGAKKVGQETLSGFVCDVNTFKNPKVGNQKVWVSEKLEYPIKMMGGEGQTSFSAELSNIKTGGVSDDMFQPPADYKQMQMPAGMPGVKGGS